MPAEAAEAAAGQLAAHSLAQLSACTVLTRAVSSFSHRITAELCYQPRLTELFCSLSPTGVLIAIDLAYNLHR